LQRAILAAARAHAPRSRARLFLRWQQQISLDCGVFMNLNLAYASVGRLLTDDANMKAINAHSDELYRYMDRVREWMAQVCLRLFVRVCRRRALTALRPLSDHHRRRNANQLV